MERNDLEKELLDTKLELLDTKLELENLTSIRNSTLVGAGVGWVVLAGLLLGGDYDSIWEGIEKYSLCVPYFTAVGYYMGELFYAGGKIGRKNDS